MSEPLFNTIVWCWIALAIIVIPPQLLITAPYGRHRSHKWGPGIDNRLGWVVMEGASPVAFAWTMFAVGGPGSAPVWIFLILWMGHYLHRAFIYPLRTRTAGTFIPLSIVVAGIGFNGFNGWINGYAAVSPWGGYADAWLADPRFLVGLVVFATGAAINIWADSRLIALRANGETGYVIPRGGLFERVSCPNHLGEIIEWTGFAILCWNLPAASFALWTAANLGPRAISHHRWYRQNFPDYPAGRTALVPYLI